MMPINLAFLSQEAFGQSFVRATLQPFKKYYESLPKGTIKTPKQ